MRAELLFKYPIITKNIRFWYQISVAGNCSAAGNITVPQRGQYKQWTWQTKERHTGAHRRKKERNRWCTNWLWFKLVGIKISDHFWKFYWWGYRLVAIQVEGLLQGRRLPPRRQGVTPLSRSLWLRKEGREGEGRLPAWQCCHTSRISFTIEQAVELLFS